MLHNTCLFCSIKIICIYPKISVYIGALCSEMYCLKQKSDESEEPHQITEILIINIDKDTSDIRRKINIFLIQPLCQISKRLYGESTLCYYVRSMLSYRITYNHFPAKERAHRSQKLCFKSILWLF